MDSNDSAYRDGLLRQVEAIVGEVEPTWRDCWPTMGPIERTHFLNVELLDADRYLLALQNARAQHVLTPRQDQRLDAVLALRERVRPTLAALTATALGDTEAAGSAPHPARPGHQAT